MRVAVLGSGSAGNATFVWAGNMDFFSTFSVCLTLNSYFGGCCYTAKMFLVHMGDSLRDLVQEVGLPEYYCVYDSMYQLKPNVDVNFPISASGKLFFLLFQVVFLHYKD